MMEIVAVTQESLATWADDASGPVALTLHQTLQPVEGDGAVIFPPTYAEIGYNIDKLEDGSSIAQIDSVGSQANRMEPMFKDPPFSELIPQIAIKLNEDKTVSILDAGHRLGDAVVRVSALGEQAQKAFLAYRDENDATQIAKLAPTSLVFGAWDSRDTQAKLPRIVSSVVRALDVSALTRSAQFTPAANYVELGLFDATEAEKGEKDKKSPLAQRGYIHVPAPKQRGGVVVRGEVYRSVTINLVALRRLHGQDTDSTAKLRRYILGLALVAATEPQDGFLRQGCQLTPHPEAPAVWSLVARTGERQRIEVDSELALAFARKSAAEFEIGASGTFPFDKERAKSDLKKKD